MPKRRKYLIIVIVLLLLLPLARMGYKYGRSVWGPIYVSIKGKRQVNDVIAQIGSSARARLRSYFDKVRVPYAPGRASFLAFKQEKTLELWAEKGSRWVYIRTYPVLAASGQAGPKLRQGDRQVPEGIYGVVGLNPNSSYYLSIKINYPNNFDQQKAALDKRTDLGGDIFVHSRLPVKLSASGGCDLGAQPTIPGSNSGAESAIKLPVCGKDRSIGCLAMGDEAIEELFTLVNDVGVNQVRVIIAPHDMRPDASGKAPPANPDPNILWLPELYGILSQELKEYR